MANKTLRTVICPKWIPSWPNIAHGLPFIWIQMSHKNSQQVKVEKYIPNTYLDMICFLNIKKNNLK